MPKNLIINKHLSPNFERRLQDSEIKFLIIHYTECDFKTALKILTDAQATNRVSAHYLIDYDGTILNLVPEEFTAWHAGVSSWRNFEQINPWSIGIELVNPGHRYGYCAFDSRQMNSLIKLCHQILKRHNIPAEFILGHSDIAPLRKIDPGELFNWSRLAKEGIGFYPHDYALSSCLEIDYVQLLLSQWGYTLPTTGQLDDTTQFVLHAFQRHYCQDRVDGTIYSELVGKLEALCQYAPSQQKDS